MKRKTESRDFKLLDTHNTSAKDDTLSRTVKKSRNSLSVEAEPIDNEISVKPPSDDPTTRRKWNIVKPNKGDGVIVMNPKQIGKSTGIKISDYVIGAGPEPQQGAIVKLTYEGMFPDGTLFDSRLKRKKPLSFRKGLGQVVRGLDLGLDGMRVGGAREIVVPSELGFVNVLSILESSTVHLIMFVS